MARRLRAPVFVNGAWFKPGEEDTIPKEFAEQLHPRVWVDETEGRELTGPTPPPMAGKGSGTDAWIAYAGELRVDITDLDKRDDIVTAIRDAGHPVE